MKKVTFLFSFITFLLFTSCQHEVVNPTPKPQVTEAYFVYQRATDPQQVIEPIVYYGEVTSANGDVDFGLNIGGSRGLCPVDLSKIQLQNAKFRGSNLTSKTWVISPLRVRDCK